MNPLYKWLMIQTLPLFGGKRKGKRTLKCCISKYLKLPLKIYITGGAILLQIGLNIHLLFVFWVNCKTNHVRVKYCIQTNLSYVNAKHAL